MSGLEAVAVTRWHEQNGIVFVILVNGHEQTVRVYWFKRWNGESDWNGGNDWINLHVRDEFWSRRSSRRNDAVLALGHDQKQRVEAIETQRRGAVEHPRSEER